MTENDAKMNTHLPSEGHVKMTSAIYHQAVRHLHGSCPTNRHNPMLLLNRDTRAKRGGTGARC